MTERDAMTPDAMTPDAMTPDAMTPDADTRLQGLLGYPLGHSLSP